MRLATLRRGEGTAAAVQVDAGFTLLDAPDVGTLLATPAGLEEAASAEAKGDVHVVTEDAEFAALITHSVKVICCGLNYSDHILEMGRELPEFPTLFAKYADTLCGAHDAIRSDLSQKVD